MNYSLLKTLLLSLLLSIALSACRDEVADDLEDDTTPTDSIIYDDDDTTAIIDTLAFTDWTELTHGNVTAPDYGVVFPQTEVLRFDINISAEDWSAMQSDLSSLLGNSNSGPGGPGGPGGGQSADIEENPEWVPCSFKFNGLEWYNVGIRYKGNSSLKSAYQSGNEKLSLKLDFDQFENEYGLANQRFYGFKQLNMNNNYNDASLMREKVGADVFREFGLVAAEANFCVVYVDYGAGPLYYGVYTLVEEIDDTALETQLGDDSGNLYKPDGDAASFASGRYNESELVKKSNEDLADYTDVKSLYDIINSSTRTSDVEAWKNELEGIFNVDGFLKWLAANVVIQNWDTYGNMTHNYFLYNNPNDSLLTWIPWDNNEAFEYGKQYGSLSFSLSEVGSSWPLISYIIAQAEYKATYEVYLQQFIDDVFSPDKMTATYAAYYELLKEHAYAERSGCTYIYQDSYFDAAVSSLKSHVSTRNSATVSYLN